jgi:E3 ubiquitin-protein ligase TRIP12
MNEPERRLFLRFLTGNPTLPAGGLHGLKPCITVVRRESDNSSINSDEYLPSVMTCVNYLKLPPYSTREVLASKLHAAMRQGQAAFHLS